MGTSGEQGLRLSVLGPLRGWRDGVELDLGPRQRRVVLGLLLVRAGRRVGVSELVDAVWGEDPPPSVVNLVHRHVGAVRRLFEPELAARAEGRWLARAGDGYRLAEPGDVLDLCRFRALGVAAGAAADPGAATATYAEALALWQGRCCADLATAPGRVAFLDVDGEYLAAVRAAAAAALAAGRPAAVLAAARAAARWEPWDERVHADVMVLLAAAGQRREALAVYRDLRERLDRELGVEPGAELRAARRRVLAGAAGTPAELPPAVAGFAGRDAELAALDALADGAAPAVVVSAISGTAGVGKTALAVRWCHRVAGRYPDGRLYLDLRGYSPQPPVAPADALGRLLRALGVPPEEVPRSEDERAARYRSLLAGRRVLVLLDNATSSAQVRPLLPGTAGCLAVVTSRSRLTGLVSRDGARRLDLDVLTAAEAEALLTGLLPGRAGVATEPEAVAELARRCGYLPLALRVAAAGLRDRPHRTVVDAVAALAADRLAALAAAGDAADPSSAVTSVFSWSLRALDPVAAHVFLLLGVYPGDDVGAGPVAALANLEPVAAGSALDRLAGQHLVQEEVAGRYRVHDLLRDYARSRAAVELPAGERDAALDRLCDWYLRLLATDPGLDVLDRERANFVVAVGAAAAADRPACLRLTAALRDFFGMRAYWEDWADTHAAALASAERQGDRDGRVQMLLGEGSVLVKTGRAAEALDRFRAAEKLCEDGDVEYQARRMGGTGLALMDLGDHAAGLDLLARAREAWQRLGGPDREFAAVINLSDGYRRVGRLAEAGAVLDEAAELAAAVGDASCVAMVCHNRAEILADLGLYADAVAPLDEALRIWRETGERKVRLDTLALLATVHDALGDDRVAAGYRREAAALLSRG